MSYAAWAGVALYLVLQLSLIGAVIGLIVASIRRRRHREATVADPAWTRTDEVFRDPATLRVMRVWIDASSNRHYVAED